MVPKPWLDIVDHSCRDYETLQRWPFARDAADAEHYPQNAARINAERIKSMGTGKGKTTRNR